MVILEYQNIKTFLQKVTLVKNTVLQTYVISDLNGEEIGETFYKKSLQKANQKEFRVEKVIMRKGNKLCVKWKGYNNLLIVGLIKKTQYK